MNSISLPDYEPSRRISFTPLHIMCPRVHGHSEMSALCLRFQIFSPPLMLPVAYDHKAEANSGHNGEDRW